MTNGMVATEMFYGVDLRWFRSGVPISDKKITVRSHFRSVSAKLSWPGRVRQTPRLRWKILTIDHTSPEHEVLPTVDGLLGRQLALHEARSKNDQCFQFLITSDIQTIYLLADCFFFPEAKYR